MKCDVCKNNDTYIKSYEHNYTIKGKEIKFTSDRRFCSHCNNLVYDSKLDNDASIVAIQMYNKKYGIDKEKIIKLRNDYNLSQELFAKIIGCAKKTLISYEKGTSIPNDNYIIILNSLIAKPETIVTLIEANKEQFTNKEYEKIDNKLSLVLQNNKKQMFSDKEFKISEYNGYTKLDKDKVFNMILFFADKCILKTKLLKQLFYTDFLFYKKNCKSITGLEYFKLPYGPVPDQYEQILSEGCKNNIIDYKCEFKNNYESHNITKKIDFKKELFTDKELEIMNQVKEFFEKYGSKDIVEFSHKEIAFIENDYYKPISYDYAFDITSLN